MIGEAIIFGTSRKDEPHFWRFVHETEDQVIYMLDDLWAEQMLFREAQEALKNDFLILTDEERARIIPNENGELFWLPSVKQLGFVPSESYDAWTETGWDETKLNNIPYVDVPEEVWEEETFQYFADPETARECRLEFGRCYWTSTPLARDPRFIWVSGPCTARRVPEASYHKNFPLEIRPCVILRRTAII